MSNTLSQIPLAIAAGSTFLTLWYMGQKGQGESRWDTWPGRRQLHGARLTRTVTQQSPRRRLLHPRQGR